MTTATSIPQRSPVRVVRRRNRTRSMTHNTPRSLAKASESYQLVVPGTTPVHVPVRPVLLDLPLYVVARKLRNDATGQMVPLEDCTKFAGPSGYQMCQLNEGPEGMGLPSIFDYRVLWHIAARLPRFSSYAAVVAVTPPAQRRAMRSVEVPSLRGLVKELSGKFDGASGSRCTRIREAILRWKGIVLDLPSGALSGIPTRRGSKPLAILEEVVFEDDDRGKPKRIVVRFHEDFMHCLGTESGHAVDLTMLANMASPTAARLWEMLGVVFRKPVKGPGARRRVWRIPLTELMQRLGTQRERHLATTLSAAFDQIHAFDPSINYDLELDYDEDEPMANFTCTRLPAALK